MAKHREHFDIDASIVFQLGEDLITDVVQALIELVKNCYDADSDYAKVQVDTTGKPPDENSYFSDAPGFIVIEDSGTGMDQDEIENGWLTISKSSKRQLKLENRTTSRGRTPLGDKGLGRLGAQRLGYNIEIFTRPRGADVQHHVGWTWHDFRGETTLTNVKIRWEELDAGRNCGTRIVISDLRETESWQGSAYQTVANQLSQMISPYKQVRDFDIIASVDGKELELATISQSARSNAQVRYRLNYNGDRLSIEGRAKLDLLRPKTRNDASLFEELVLADDGAAFLEYLLGQKQAGQIKLRRSSSQAWFVDYSMSRRLEDMDRVVRAPEAPNGNPVAVSPGPFTAEIDAFDLTQASAQQSTFDTLAEYRGYVRALSGVRIYRDGFGVRVDRDWLGLGKQWTGASSYYGLKPDNTLGFVALTARDNSALIETTDREGFKDTPAHRNFVRMFAAFVDFAHSSQELLRRSWLEYRKEHEKESAGVAKSASAEDVSIAVVSGLKKVADYRTPITALQRSLSSALEESAHAFDDILHAPSLDTSLARKCTRAKEALTARVSELQTTVERIAEDVQGASHLFDVAKVLDTQIHSMRDQMQQSVEAMSLGLTAEVLSHEIANIVDQLAMRTKDINAHVTRKAVNDAKILGFIEYVSTTANGLRRQLAHLAPSLKYARTRRTEFSVTEFCEELASYHRARWQGIPLRLLVDEQRAMIVRINRGKLTQVVDNLVLNSEYWVREDVQAKRISEGTITFRIAAPHLLVSDDGQGIDSAVEGSLFEPFVTLKKGGRGLGLYVAKQLLDSEGAAIRLRPRRNSHGRFYQFEIDLSQCMVEGDA